MSLGDAYADAHLDTDSLDSDIAQVSAMLNDAVAQWESILSVSGTVDMDTTEATAQIEAAVDAWNAMLDENLAAAVDLDTSEATAHLVTAREEWSRLAADPIEAKVQVVVEDAESLANLTTTFTGIKPLLDLPVRFHLDQASVIETTTAISGYAAAWSEALDLKVTPNMRPPGDNDLPSQPGRRPAQPRGPPGEPVVRPQVDPTDAEIQARLLTQVLEGILKAAATVRIDGDQALADAETLAPLIERVVSTSAEVQLDGEGLIEHAEALRQLVEQTLADAKARPSLDGGSLIGQIEALAAAIDDILDVTATPDLDESAFRAKLIALTTEVETLVGNIPVGIEPELDPERSVADARLIKRLLEGVLKVTVPVDMSDTEAVAQAETLAPLIERILRITTTVDLDGAGAVAEAEAIGTLLDNALDIAMKVDFDSGGATAQATALKATINGILRDLVINTDLDGGEATAHAVALRAVLERILGRDIEINVDVDSGAAAATGAATGAMSVFSRLFGSLGGGGGEGGSDFTKKLAKGFGEVASSVGGALGPMLKFGAIFAGITVALPLILGGVSALAAAAGGIIGLAAAFATLAVSIGGAAAAMPILGVALNKDLVERAKGGLNELKNNVAAITRGLGEQLLSRFQGPFVNVLSNIAASATKLGDALFPVLDAVVGFLGKFNAVLQTSDAREFVDKLSASIVEWIDMFGDYLDDYLKLVNDVFGSTSGIRDFAKTILDLGLQAGPLFKAIGTFISEMAKGIGALGPVALPVVTKLVDLLTKIGNSDPFQQMVRGGIAMFDLLLDLIDQIGDGIANIGIDDAMSVLIGAFDKLVNSGFGEKLGEIFATLMESGSMLVDLIADVAGSDAFTSIIEFFQQAIPLVIQFVRGFGEGLTALSNDQGNAFTSFLKSLLHLLGGAVALAKPLGVALAAVSLVFTGFISGLALVTDGIISFVTVALGAIVEFVEKISVLYDYLTPRPVGEAVRAWAKDASDSIWGFERKVANNMVSFQENLWSADVSVGKFGANVNNVFGNGEKVVDQFSTATERFSDVLGGGAGVLENYARANNLTSEQIRAAGDAAAAATEQFKNTADLIGKLREEAAKPIALNVDFSKTKLDLDKLVNYVDAQVKTTQEKVGSALYADPGAQDLASGVMGADGTNLAGLTDQTITKETFVPAHLEQSVMDSIDQLMENVDRDVANKDYLTSLRFSGFADLADQLEKFDGPKLELAIEELGNVGSAKVREANEKLKQAQREADVGFNPIQAAIADAQKSAILKVRQVEVVKELEDAGFSRLATQYATLKPEDLEAAIRSYDAMGGANGPLAQQMEDQLKQLEQVLSEKATEIDPLGKMWDTLGEKGAAAQLAAIDRFLTPEEIAVALHTDTQSWTPQQEANDGIVGFIADAIATTEKGAGYSTPTGTMTPEDVQRWKDLFYNTLPEGARPITDAETKIIAQLKLRNAPGMVPGGGGGSGTTEGATAGENIANAVADGLGGDASKKKVADAADSLVGSFTDTLKGAPDDPGIKGTLTDGAAKLIAQFTDSLIEKAPLVGMGSIALLMAFVEGVTTSVTDYMGAAAASVATTFVEMLNTNMELYKPVLGAIGAAFIQPVIDGITEASDTEAGKAAATFLINTVAQIEATADMTYPMLGVIGGKLTGALTIGMNDPALAKANGGAPGDGVIEAIYLRLAVAEIESGTKIIGIGSGIAKYLTIGFTIGLFPLFLRLASLGQDIANRLKDVEGVAVAQGRALGAAIGHAIADALTKSLSQAGVADGPSDGIKGAITKAANAAKSADAPGVSIGQALVDGIILGIQSRVPDLIAAATAVATIVSTVIRTRMAIRSPSGVTMLMGEQIAEGLAIGIENGHGRVAGAVEGLTTSVSAPISLRPQFPPSATADRPELLEAVQALLVRSAGAQTGATPNAAEMAAPGGWRGRGPDPATGNGAFIHADVVNINGVPGAAEMPQRTTAGFWRLGYGESVSN